MRFEATLSEVSAAVAVGDWQALAELLSDSFFNYTPGIDEPTAGERIIEVLSDIKKALPDLTVTFSDPAAEGDLLNATLTLRGTHTNPLWGSPGSRNPIKWTNSITIKKIDGRIAINFEDASLSNLVPVLRQLELVNPADEMDRPPLHPYAIPEFVLKVLMTGRAGDIECRHLDQIQMTEPTSRMCVGCVSEGTSWPALRMCLTCGFVGCCDMSKNTHLKQHYEETGHPLMRSVNMDEGWVWCYEDNAFFERGLLERYPLIQ